MKRYQYILLFIAVQLIAACSPSLDKITQKACSHFIDEVQYMTERESIENGIDYYRAPDIYRSDYLGPLTGREVVKVCNRLIKEDQEKEYIHLGPMVFKTFRKNVFPIKEYAVDHPDDIVGYQFYFGGTFTHYNNGYGSKEASVLYIPDLDDALIEENYSIFDI